MADQEMSLFDLEDFVEEGIMDIEEEMSNDATMDRSYNRQSWQLDHLALQMPGQDGRVNLPADVHDVSFAFDDIDKEVLPQIMDTIPKDSEKNDAVSTSWGDLDLSRPVLQAISTVLKFGSPSRIQCEAIPIAMSGKDILACASTGSGKTASFLVPIIERLIQSSNIWTQRRYEKDAVTGRLTVVGGSLSKTRAIVILPTRELAVQCWSMFAALSSFVPVTSSLVVGGFDQFDQKRQISKEPDVIIATPGRLLDHILNSQGVHLDHVDMVVLDEADRLLEMGFKESVMNILENIPKKAMRKGKKMPLGECQTLLFSATMSLEVKDLANVVLSDAVLLKVDESSKVVDSLIQEFIKIGSEDLRTAAFFSLLETHVHKSISASGGSNRVIVFFKEKRESHLLTIIGKLFGLKIAELNGNMNQQMRLQSMADFQSGKSHYLFATDVASRGLDLPFVEFVINYNLPPSMDAETRYVHRVGRTARMGRNGRSITLFSPEEYPVVKRIIKKTTSKADRDSRVLERKLSRTALATWTTRLAEVRNLVTQIEGEDKIERETMLAEQHARKLQNLVSHKKDIQQRPEKVWIKSNQPTRPKRGQIEKPKENQVNEKKSKSSKQRKFDGKQKSSAKSFRKHVSKLETQSGDSHNHVLKHTKRFRKRTSKKHSRAI